MKTKNELIQELLALAFRVNVETDYCVFTRDSGHVGELKFDIALSKKEYRSRLESFEFYYDAIEGDTDFNVDVQKFIGYFNKLLAGGVTTRYKATFHLGSTKVSKIFNTEDERTNWVIDSRKNIGLKDCIMPELNEIKSNRKITL